MKAKLINFCNIEGLIYDHKLEIKTSGPNSKNPGTEYINGTIEIATDNSCLNIIPVFYTYCTATTSKGNTNATFTTLKNVIDGKFKTIMTDGKDVATKVRISSAIGLNEFYSDRSGTEELVSVKRNEGGFIHIVDTLNGDESQRNTFKCDMLITNVTVKEADEERGLPEKAIVKGAIFDFRGGLLPVEFSATNSGAIAYFEGLDASNTTPTFTCLWGKQISETIKRTITTESAFGEADVREVESTRKDFVITGANPEPYVWDDESSMTIKELEKAMADRQTYLATMKARNDEYKASRNAGAPATTVTNAGFNF